ncbi:MAG: dipeptidase PepE [Methylocella sp.]
MRLLLISATGSPYFEHCKREMFDFLGLSKSVGFVSAANVFDEEAYFRAVDERLIGTVPAVAREFVHIRWNSNWRDTLNRIDAIMVGGGNTYALLKRLHQSGLLDALRERVRNGLPYIGASAGSNVAGPNILTTNDWNVVGLTRFESLGLVPFNINPHYAERAASDAPHSETRDDRIREFHQICSNDVVALEESAILRVVDKKYSIVGKGRAKLFTKGDEPRLFEAGEDLPVRFMDEFPSSSYPRFATTP